MGSLHLMVLLSVTSYLVFAAWVMYCIPQNSHKVFSFYIRHAKTPRAQLLSKGIGEVRCDAQHGEIRIHSEQLTAKSRLECSFMGENDGIGFCSPRFLKNFHGPPAVTHQFHVLLLHHELANRVRDHLRVVSQEHSNFIHQRLTPREPVPVMNG